MQLEQDGGTEFEEDPRHYCSSYMSVYEIKVGPKIMEGTATSSSVLAARTYLRLIVISEAPY